MPTAIQQEFLPSPEGLHTHSCMVASIASADTCIIDTCLADVCNADVCIAVEDRSFCHPL